MKVGTLDKVDMLISTQIGLFHKILQLMSFHSVDLTSQKDTF